MLKRSSISVYFQPLSLVFGVYKYLPLHNPYKFPKVAYKLEFCNSNSLKDSIFFLNGKKFYKAKNFLIYFNWRLITLQYCGGFCHTLTWISHGCTCVPHPDPPSPSHPSGSSQCTSLEHPVPCIKRGLVIYFTYDNIHVSVLFSQIIPPSPSPRVQESVLYTCVSFAISHIGSSWPSI